MQFNQPVAEWIRAAALVIMVALPAACSTLMPGAGYPRPVSVALSDPESTRFGARFAPAAAEHAGESAFHILTAGVDGFLTRVQMVDAAERTLDLQYYIFRNDETGHLLADALVRAAERGVRVRILLDDGDTVSGDEQIAALDGHTGIEVRIFNPFRYRGHLRLLRGIEFTFNAPRLDYRMHNKLMVADGSVALVGGRNIGNQYFQMDPDSQFADDDVFCAGPVVRRLSASFDEYWNSGFAIPARALGRVPSKTIAAASGSRGGQRRAAMGPLAAPGVDYVAKIATGQPFGGLLSGQLALTWAQAEVVVDSPDKKRVGSGEVRGRLMATEVAATAGSVDKELLMVTPYLIPTAGEMELLANLRRREVSVRILTNSLEAAPEAAAHAGYMHHRLALLKEGVELHEARALLGSTRGSGQTRRLSRYGNYALHAKLFVFDRQKVFLGSMNFDERSRHLNTEIGLIIDNPELAGQTELRFEGMIRPENAFLVRLRTVAGSAPASARPRLEWDTTEQGKAVVYTREPSRSACQRLEVELLSVLPIDQEM